MFQRKNIKIVLEVNGAQYKNSKSIANKKYYVLADLTHPRVYIPVCRIYSERKNGKLYK